MMGSSTDLLRESFKKPTVRLSEENLKHLVALTDLEGVDLIDWQTKGIPAPDGSWGVWRVQPDFVAEVAKLLAELRHYHWWFPRGIPVIDHFEVYVSNAPPGRF
jgi:hypothetical protein